MKIEVAASSRAVCRECGATIDPGEPRCGRDEGPPDARRTRWRHLACAAQSMPDALLRALELDGWRSVPTDDQQDLRAMIERARTDVVSEPSDSIRLSRRAAGLGDDPQAGRSSSAMAAAAVLEPAHEAARLPPDQARAWVFADALQVRGDPRGELLALELAAEHTSDPARARALQREHHACWNQFAAPLRASKDLRLRWVGGFLLAAQPRAQREIHRLLASPAAAELERVRLEFCTQDELERLVSAARTRGRPLRTIELPNSRFVNPRPLAELDTLDHLRVGGQVPGELLRRVSWLRGLSLTTAPAQLDTATLALAPALERLELGVDAPARLDDLGARLPKLRELTLRGLPLDHGPTFLADATQLWSLRLPESPLRELGPLARLTRLRELSIAPGSLRLVPELGALTGLERLALRGNMVGELDALSELEQLEHLALLGVRTTTLSPLRELPRLRSLSISSGDMRRIAKLGRLTRLEQLRLAKLANLDLTALTELERLDTLVLAPGGRRPQQLDALARLPALRRLSVPLALLDEVERPDRLLANIEVLELADGRIPQQALLDALPRLCRLLVPGCDPTELARVAEANPELACFADPSPRDELDRRDPFDWRSVPWMPGATPA